MTSKLVILICAAAACHAVPVWIDDNGLVPGVVMRIGRSPGMAFGFGSGFSSSIGGINHATGMGTSFQTGGGQAFGGGFAGAGENQAFAQGMGMASSLPTFYAPPAFQDRRNYNSAENTPNNFNLRQNAPQQYIPSQNGVPARYQNAFSSAQNRRGYESAMAAAQNHNGRGYESAASAVRSGDDYGSAIAAAQHHDGQNDFNAAMSAAQHMGAYRGSTAQAVRQRGDSMQNAGASSVNGPGIRAAQSHAVETGDFY